jgi:hypothetical protein
MPLLRPARTSHPFEAHHIKRIVDRSSVGDPANIAAPSSSPPLGLISPVEHPPAPDSTQKPPSSSALL